MDKKLIAVARAIHLAKVRECSFPGHDGQSGYDARLSREPWPEDRAEFTRLQQAGQPWIDLALAQARAALKAIDDARA